MGSHNLIIVDESNHAPQRIGSKRDRRIERLFIRESCGNESSSSALLLSGYVSRVDRVVLAQTIVGRPQVFRVHIDGPE